MYIVPNPIEVRAIEKYKIYFFSNFPNKEIFKKLNIYSVIVINPSALPTPTNKLYFLRKGDNKVETTLTTKNTIATFCILLSFKCLKKLIFLNILKYIKITIIVNI